MLFTLNERNHQKESSFNNKEYNKDIFPLGPNVFNSHVTNQSRYTAELLPKYLQNTNSNDLQSSSNASNF